MWKAAAGQTVNIPVEDGGDDWETDPDFENDVTEQEQRWGAKTVAGSGHQEHINIHQLRANVSTEHTSLKKKELEDMPKASHGYGGKFGVQQDRMDKSAVGHDYQSQLSKHCSQTDTSKGFGGKFGVQADRVDQSAVGFEYAGKTEKHASQKDYSTGFGGRYGVQADRSQTDYAKGFGGKYGVESDKVDKSAMGFEYQGKTEKHESQKDYTKGFGGKFGVQTDRQDKSAMGWDHQEKLQLHESQKDYKHGFGGRYGVQAERRDQCALGFDHKESLSKHDGCLLFAVHSTAPHCDGPIHALFLHTLAQSAGTFEDIDKPSSAYQKTKPVEAAGSGAGSIKPAPVRIPSPAPLAQPPPARPTYQNTAAPEEEQLYVVPTDVVDVEEKVASSLPEENLYQNVPVAGGVADSQPYDAGEDAGVTAVALYDYQAAGDDEISFDPDDIITNIEMIDEGWWRGVCRGAYGLFPANYVEVRP
ncbi:hypothetical protein NHX12_006475 [Muraenolepis orangiensis]|uniref:SH3 domain-containing protein n=1 Tax=Muraenolepis orangiensis TaxID=630683 RepID=A0A9Q0DTK1_9TELE|nr:hypothetical protein NHX12_006475 [Muraenolepis orangiensis]